MLGARFIRPLVLAAAGLALLAGASQAQSKRAGIEAVSNRPDLISNGDVLVRVTVPAGVDAASAAFSVNGEPAIERRGAATDRTFLAKVERLPLGPSVISVSAAGKTFAKLAVVNHPNGGPVFSGAQIQPWKCLPSAMNAQCDRATRIRYVYMPTGATAFKEYDPSKPRPADIATAVTPEGVRLPYIVRIESITQNRSGVQVATLFDPSKPWTPFAPQAQWNKGVYVLQGSGCGTGFEEKAAGDPLHERALSKGFLVVTAALLHNTNNCNPIVQAEAALMAKEHVAETYGPFDLVFAQGSSGGAISQIADQNAYPGLYDGLILNHLFADSDASRNAAYDCRLANDAMAKTGTWSDAEKVAVLGMLSGCASSPDRFNIYNAGVGTSCTIPDAQKFSAANMKGVRCTLQDYQVNQVGRRPDGYAYARLDNEGVQYGLKALKEGVITPEKFVALNAAIGGHDINFNRTETRTVADKAGLKRLYQTGIGNPVNNLGETPVIETRLNVTDFHQPFHAVMVRARLEAAQGHHNNYALWKTAAAREPGLNEAAFDTMVAWIKAIQADKRSVPKAQKVIDNRPALAKDRCIVGGKDAALSECPRPLELTRVRAGAPDANYPGKCRLKPLNKRDYGAIVFTSAQWASLQKTFSTGVCDYTKPMVGFTHTTPWLTYASGKPAPLPKK